MNCCEKNLKLLPKMQMFGLKVVPKMRRFWQKVLPKMQNGLA